MSLTLKELEKRKESLKAELANIEILIDAKLRETAVICSICHTGSKIGDVTFLQHMWYESPHGCMGGDFWHVDFEDGDWICPSCGQKNRLYNNPDLLELRGKFKEILEVDEKGRYLSK